MFRKSEREGYLMIDHRESPGLTGADLIKAGRTKLAGHIGPGQLFEGATYTCSHCQKVVVKNPDRLRARAYCSNCDHDICDGCGAEMKMTGTCVPFAKLQDQFLATGVVPDQLLRRK